MKIEISQLGVSKLDDIIISYITRYKEFNQVGITREAMLEGMISALHTKVVTNKKKGVKNVSKK